MLAQSDEKARLDSLKAAYAADLATLDRLENTNVYNDAFNIGQDGPIFGTINGLRFGRMGTVDGRSVTVNIPLLATEECLNSQRSIIQRRMLPGAMLRYCYK